ncbi:MAG TPA: hypothetical protein VF219_04245, partial [Vicinamibacterales bacterium]
GERIARQRRHHRGVTTDKPTVLMRFVRWTIEHSLLLPIGALVALVWANIDQASYTHVAHAIELPVNEIGWPSSSGLPRKVRTGRFSVSPAGRP